MSGSLVSVTRQAGGSGFSIRPRDLEFVLSLSEPVWNYMTAKFGSTDWLGRCICMNAHDFVRTLIRCWAYRMTRQGHLGLEACFGRRHKELSEASLSPRFSALSS